MAARFHRLPTDSSYSRAKLRTANSGTIVAQFLSDGWIGAVVWLPVRSPFVKTKKAFGMWRLLLIGACLLSAAGCSTAGQSDRPAAIAGQCFGSGCAPHESDGRVAWLGPQVDQETTGYYASHCSEQTRELQHELANCTAVPLVNIPLAPPPRS